jgi:hypothetical protein
MSAPALPAKLKGVAAIDHILYSASGKHYVFVVIEAALTAVWQSLGLRKDLVF